MSRTDPQRRSSPPKARGARGTTDTRIDAAHVVASPEAPAPACQEEPVRVVDVAPALTGAPSPAEQLRIQAAQLADYLRARQCELDHRESRLNAQMAQLDAATRQAQFWITEKQNELVEASQGLEEQRRELETRQGQLKSAQTTTEQRLAEQELLRKQAEEVHATVKEKLQQACEELARKEELLREREWEIKVLGEKLDVQAVAQKGVRSALSQEHQRVRDALQHEKQKIDAHREASQQLVRQMLAGLERRREAVEADAERLLAQAARPSPDLLEREEQSKELIEHLEVRQRELDERETQVVVAEEEIAQEREDLAAQRRKNEEQARGERQRLAIEQRRAAAELEEKRLVLQRRSEHVDQCRRGLEQLRTEMGNMHRETLEIRLATEELWIQLSGTAPSPVLTRSLDQIRAKLSEHYRAASEDLVRQKNDLLAIRTELAQQHQRLLQQKQELERWAAQRREEIEQKAARLVAREQELDRQETELRQRPRSSPPKPSPDRPDVHHLRIASCDAETLSATG